MKKWIIVIFSVLVIVSISFYLSLNRIEIPSETEEITLRFQGDFFHQQNYESIVITDNAQIDSILQSIRQIYSFQMDSKDFDNLYYEFVILYGDHSIHIFNLDTKYFMYDNVVYKVVFGDFQFLLDYEWIAVEV